MTEDKESMILKLMKCNNCFNSLHLENKKDKEDTFHEKIKEDKDFLYNFFKQQPYYKESMPIIQKSYKGTPYYQELIKGSKRKTRFYKTILKAIKQVEEEKKIKLTYKEKKMVKYYRLPQIEILRRRAKKLKDMFITKQKFNKNNSDVLTPNNTKSKSTFFNSTNNSNIFKQTSLSVSPNNLKNKTFNDNNFYSPNAKSIYKIKTKGFLSPQNKTMGGTFFNNFTNEKKINNFSTKNFIINKCREEISLGKKVVGNFNKYNNQLDKELSEKLRETMLKNNDQTIIEEKSKKNKYKAMEESTYGNIKRKMDKKISAVFAYVNRKEFEEILKNNEKIDAYDLYLKEMNKINEKLSKNKVVECKKLKKIEEMLDDIYKQKEFLKVKINKYNIKNSKKKIPKYWSLNDDFFITRNLGDEFQGTLLPKLLKIQKEKIKKNMSTGDLLNTK